VPGTAPKPEFASVALDLATIPAGTLWGRIFASRFTDPLGTGKVPSRFSDPRRRIAANRFGVLYVGSSLKVCFVEAILRDQADGRTDDVLLDEGELRARTYATLRVDSALSLVDLRGDGPLRMGVPSDVARSSEQTLARKWSLAFHQHPSQVDGIVYPSRLNGETNLAIYDRAISKLSVHASRPLIREPGLAAVLRDLKVGLY
jgi:hypothetical protein